MRRAGDKIVFAVAQRLVGAVDREDQLGRDVEPVPREMPELGRGERGEIRVRDQIGDRQPHPPQPIVRLEGNRPTVIAEAASGTSIGSVRRKSSAFRWRLDDA